MLGGPCPLCYNEVRPDLDLFPRSLVYSSGTTSEPTIRSTDWGSPRYSRQFVAILTQSFLELIEWVDEVSFILRLG